MTTIMEEKYVDLHVHTKCSDGTFSPKDAVDYAKKAGLAAISITDHDTVDAIPAAMEEGKIQGVEIIPGVELSCEVENQQRSEMHILGYYMEWEDPMFRDFLKIFRKARHDRAEKILKKLESIGISLKEGVLERIAGEGSIGRLHFAKAIVESGFAKSVQEVFQKYLSADKPAYVPKYKLSPEDGIKLIKDAGGIAVLAHPYYMHYSNRELITDLITAGLGGIEVWHSRHSPSAIKTFKQIANDLHLIATGGSDCHGPYGQESALMGHIKVSYSVVEALKKQKEKNAL